MSESEVPGPRVGEWYKDVGGDLFEVVAVDEDDGTIEIQHFDGTVEELEMDAWQEMPIELSAPPEDYSGSLDIDREDFGIDLEDLRDEQFGSSLDYFAE